MEDILKNIKYFRMERGYSQEYMAEQLGITQAGYANWEKGNRELSYNNLLLISRVLGYNVWDIIAHPRKLIDTEDVPKLEDRISVTFDVDPSMRDYLLRLVLGEK